MAFLEPLYFQMLKLVFHEEPPLFLVLFNIFRFRIIAVFALSGFRRIFSLSYDEFTHVTILAVCALIIIHIIQELFLKLRFLNMDVKSYFPHFVNIPTQLFHCLSVRFLGIFQKADNLIRRKRFALIFFQQERVRNLDHTFGFHRKIVYLNCLRPLCLTFIMITWGSCPEVILVKRLIHLMFAGFYIYY